MSLSLEEYRKLIPLTPYGRPQPFEEDGEMQEAGTQLLKYFLKEKGMIAAFNIPIEKKQALIRRYVNTRMPIPVPPEILALQDRILWTLSLQRGIVRGEDLPQDGKGFSLWEGDITRLAVDAIVNSANATLLGCFKPGHNCVDNAIHSFAGMQVRDDCASIMANQGGREEAGNAKITCAYNLPSKYIIHTVGPVVGTQLTEGDRQILRSCYTSCLNLAAEMELKSIAFCCLSSGLYNFPRGEAAEIAVGAVYNWKLRHPDYAIHVVFDTFLPADTEIYSTILSAI